MVATFIKGSSLPKRKPFVCSNGHELFILQSPSVWDPSGEVFAGGFCKECNETYAFSIDVVNEDIKQVLVTNPSKT